MPARSGSASPSSPPAPTASRVPVPHGPAPRVSPPLPQPPPLPRWELRGGAGRGAGRFLCLRRADPQWLRRRRARCRPSVRPSVRPPARGTAPPAQKGRGPGRARRHRGEKFGTAQPRAGLPAPPECLRTALRAAAPISVPTHTPLIQPSAHLHLCMRAYVHLCAPTPTYARLRTALWAPTAVPTYTPLYTPLYSYTYPYTSAHPHLHVYLWIPPHTPLCTPTPSYRHPSAHPHPYTYIYTYVYTALHTPIPAYTHLYTPIYTCVQMLICTITSMLVSIYIHTPTHTHLHTHACTYTQLYTPLSLHRHLYTPTHAPTPGGASIQHAPKRLITHPAYDHGTSHVRRHVRTSQPTPWLCTGPPTAQTLHESTAHAERGVGSLFARYAATHHHHPGHLRARRSSHQHQTGVSKHHVCLQARRLAPQHLLGTNSITRTRASLSPSHAVCCSSPPSRAEQSRAGTLQHRELPAPLPAQLLGL